MAGPVYALNLFDVADRDEYLAYSRRSVKEVQAHGGRVVALGKFCEAAAAAAQETLRAIAGFLGDAASGDRKAQYSRKFTSTLIMTGTA